MAETEIPMEELIKMRDNLANQNDIKTAITFFEAAGNKERFSILNLLKNKELNVSELSELINKSQSTISHHLKILEKAGLIEGSKAGKFTQYRLVKAFFEQVDTIIKNWVANK
jgi:ArsR family transcriptional regulator